MAVSELINDDMILSLKDYVDMLTQHNVVVPSVEIISDKKVFIKDVQLINNIDLVEFDLVSISDNVCDETVHDIVGTSNVLNTCIDDIQCDQILKGQSIEDLNKRFAEAFVTKAQPLATEQLDQTDMLSSAEFKVMQKSDKNLEPYFKLAGHPDSKFYVCPSTGILFRRTSIGGAD